MKLVLVLLCFLASAFSFSQTVSEKIATAVQSLEADSTLKHGIISLYIIDNKTGTVVYEKNSQVGLPAGSVQKIITSVTAFELLGKDYRYRTVLSYHGAISNKILHGDIYINGTGDPTLGSWRYESTKEEKVLDEFTKAIADAGISSISGSILSKEIWKGEATPDGWIWQDVGSYYGAGARSLNWRENQYDVILNSGKDIDDEVTVVGTIPSKVEGLVLLCDARAAGKGSGDNAFIYYSFSDKYFHIRGTIPVNESHFIISGSMPFPDRQLMQSLKEHISKGNLKAAEVITGSNIFYTHLSPPLDSINYWFLKKSINLYGEALLKTIGYNKTNAGSTDSGIAVIKSFWSTRGIDKSALNIMDGSGLSPANRITTHTLVTVLKYAQLQSWYPSFYNALPETNGIKMKSGSIGGVLAYTGYTKNYTFALIVNNYAGSNSAMKEKMWRLLDNLK